MKKTVVAIAVLALALCLTTSYAAYLYTLQKPMTVFIAGVEGQLQLYQEASDAVVVSQVAFSPISPGSSHNSSVMYLKNIGSVTASVMWDCVDLPSDLAVLAYFGAGGSTTNWVVWTSGIGLQPGTQCPVKFQITAADPLTSLAIGEQATWTLEFTSQN